MIKLDLGCGRSKKVGYIGIDDLTSWEHQGFPNKLAMTDIVDVVWNLNKGIPYEDNCVGEVYSSHFIEHVESPSFLLNEIYRVCTNKATVIIVYPIMFEDPAHKTLMDKNWIDDRINGRFRLLNKIIMHKIVGGRHYEEARVFLEVIK